MVKSIFVQSHPAHQFNESDTFDYLERDRYFIQALKSVEALMDIDAYIFDYKNEKFLYATKNCSLLMGNSLEDINAHGQHYYEKIILHEDLEIIAPANAKSFEFFYALPVEKRLEGYYTFNFRVRDKHNKVVLMNHKVTMLDLTNDGVLRLGLCVISHLIHEKPGSAYIKMNDKSAVYQYMPSTGKFVEVKTQKLTSKAITVLRLASNGKNEAEIAQLLGISIPTVKYHKKRIFAQLGVKNTAEAIQWMNNQKKLVKKV